MIIDIDFKSEVAPFRQVADAIALRVLTGALAAGQGLPSVNDLALQIGANPRTVTGAYESLEVQGLVEPTDGDSGWAVCWEEPPATEFRLELVRRALAQVLTRAALMDVAADAASGEFEQALADVYGSDGR